MLRSFVGSVLQRGLSVLFGTRRPSSSRSYIKKEDKSKAADAAMSSSSHHDDVVMEGYFTVFAIKGEETERFMVELGCLTDPAFLGLLDLAREEYGFRQQGALAVPCRPRELQQILDDRRDRA